MATCAIACGEGRGDAAGDASAVVTDSAGVQIIEYSSAALSQLPLLAPADDFELSIGEVEGDEPFLFSRVSAAVELSDGRVVIVDRSTMALRYFSADGAFLGEVGRRGEGPGEFQSPDGWWLLPGDTIEVWDSRASRISVVTGFDAPMVQIPVDLGVGARGYYLGTYEDGRRLFWTRGGVREDSNGDRYSGQYAVMVTADEESHTVALDTLAAFEEPIAGESLQPTIWRPSPGFGFHPDGVWSWDGMEPEVRLRDRSGDLVRVVRFEQADPTVTGELFEAYREAALDGRPPEARAQFEASLEGVVLPDRVPAVLGLGANRRGEGVLIRYPRPGEPPPDEVWIIAPEGRIELRIRDLQPVEPLPFRFDRMVLVEEDELGVPRVRVRRMVPVEGGG